MWKPGTIVVCVDDTAQGDSIVHGTPLVKDGMYVVRSWAESYHFVTGRGPAVWLQEHTRVHENFVLYGIKHDEAGQDIQDVPWGTSRFRLLESKYSEVHVARFLALERETLQPTKV